MIGKLLMELYPEIMLMDGFHDCLIGVCSRFGQEEIAAYDYQKVIQKLIDDGMTEEEAIDFFEFNIIGSWVGEHTPCFINFLEDDDAV